MSGVRYICKLSAPFTPYCNAEEKMYRACSPFKNSLDSCPFAISSLAAYKANPLSAILDDLIKDRQTRRSRKR